MPIYEYLCITCGNAFELLVRSASSQEHVLCPKCSGSQINKQFSTFGVKGSGGSSGGSSAGSDASCSPGGG